MGMQAPGGRVQGASMNACNESSGPPPDFNPRKCFIGGVSHSVDEESFKVLPTRHVPLATQTIK